MESSLPLIRPTRRDALLAGAGVAAAAMLPRAGNAADSRSRPLSADAGIAAADAFTTKDRTRMLSAKLVKGAQLKVHKGGSHGMCSTDKQQVNADMLDFIKA